MNIEKIIFGFFVILALTLNLAFVVGDVDDPAHHHATVFFLVLVVNIIVTCLKLGDRSQIGALLLACSLVADLELLAAAFLWTFALHVSTGGMTPDTMVVIVSLSGGALLANVVSATIVVAETLMLRR